MAANHATLFKLTCEPDGDPREEALALISPSIGNDIMQVARRA